MAFGEFATNPSFLIRAGLVAPPNLPESERAPLFRAALATTSDARFRARLAGAGVDASPLVGKSALEFFEAVVLRSAALLATLPPARRWTARQAASRMPCSSDAMSSACSSSTARMPSIILRVVGSRSPIHAMISR